MTSFVLDPIKWVKDLFTGKPKKAPAKAKAKAKAAPKPKKPKAPKAPATE